MCIKLRPAPMPGRRSVKERVWEWISIETWSSEAGFGQEVT